MIDHLADTLFDIERLKHVGAHELGEVADLLHRNGLMEQVERLFVFDSEQPAK